MIPPLLIKSLSKLDHFDPEKFLSVHASENQLVSVHMNPQKPILDHDRWPADFSEPPFELSGRIPWASDAFYLSARPSFTLDPLFHAGAYYVQEASGMFLSFAIHQVADLNRKLNVLDLCAAPGGKSTLIQSLISPESLLVSNEVIKTRVPVLYQNMTKWGRSNGIISNNDPAHFKRLSGFFDLVIVDAPCSGSGLFRKDPAAANAWSPDLVRLCNQRQQRILADVWDSLKEDGLLIYTTCSYSVEENEEILDDIFGQYDCHSIPLSPDPAWNIVETRSDKAGAHGYRFYPDKLKGEGFFLSVIRKKQAAPVLRSSKTNWKNLRIPKSSEQQMKIWLKEIPKQYVTVGDGLHALEPGLTDDFEILKNTLYLKKAGVRLGKAGENDWIPDQELAMSMLLHAGASSVELSKENALHYLRGETFETGAAGRGWRVVNYRGQQLGWIKLLDNRMNNYYPKSWRIRQ
jgi:16S rRNA C967 or C1407 C5-methylase (RsmB/RsmF family)/NOL1/NOP2/fmu family ribosome biogenesis protein